MDAYVVHVYHNNRYMGLSTTPIRLFASRAAAEKWIADNANTPPYRYVIERVNVYD